MKLDKFKLDLYRAKRGISIKDLAKKAGVSVNVLCKPQGASIPALALGRIAKALGVDPEELIIEEVTHVSASR